MATKKSFEIGSWVVYPSHGVGKLDKIEKIKIADMETEFFVITFSKNNLTLKLPIKKAIDSGLRKMSTKTELKSVFETLSLKVKKRKMMWGKRAQEYETKINSGDPCSIAEVIRDLYRTESDAALSFSERQFLQNAMERLSKEIAIIENIEESEATKKIETILQAA